jgi:hypothetical protein
LHLVPSAAVTVELRWHCSTERLFVVAVVVAAADLFVLLIGAVLQHELLLLLFLFVAVAVTVSSLCPAGCASGDDVSGCRHGLNVRRNQCSVELAERQVVSPRHP